MSDLADRIHVLDVKAGDVLVVRVDRVVSVQTAKLIGDTVRAVLAEADHDDVPVLVLDAGMSLEVVRPEGGKSLVHKINDLRRDGLI